MASTMSILETVFGMLGIVFWSLQLLPQVINNYRAKSTEGLSYSMFIIWTLGALGFGSFSVARNLSIPIILQPQIFGALSVLCYLQCLYYGKSTQWSLGRTAVAGIAIYVVMAGIEVAAVYATKAGEDHQVKGTNTAAGVIPIILIAIGFMPQYLDIYRDRSVVGVSMAFIAADSSGAVFSIISLCFTETIDLLATLTYVVVFVCDMVIVGFYIYYNKLNPSLARVRDITEEKEQGAAGEIAGELESTIVTIVEQEQAEHKQEQAEHKQEQAEHKQEGCHTQVHVNKHHLFSVDMNGTTIPNHIHAEAVPDLPRPSLSSNNGSSNSSDTVADLSTLSSGTH